MSKPEKITIRNVNKVFKGNVHALKSVSLEVKAGSFTTLLGPSGCGKTTLLRCISGLEEPEDGETWIGDTMVFGNQGAVCVPPKKRELGMVFQSYALWPHMTVRDNIAFGLQLKKMPVAKIDRRVSNILETVSLGGYEERYPSELSGGQQQRVSLARMLAVEPRILLMDEPLSNLDAKLRVNLRSELKRIHNNTGLTIVYVTHDQIEAMSLSTHIAVMNEGTIQQFGSPDNIYQNPANTFVADFIGNPQMNLVSGTISSKDSQTIACNKKGSISIRLSKKYKAEKKDIIMGFRPEDVVLTTEENQETSRARIYSIQKTGPEQLLTLECGEDKIMAKIDKNIDVKMDQEVSFSIDAQQVNIFNAETGQLFETG